MKADLIIKNSRIVTVDDQFSLQEAVAIKDGIIIAVGSDDSMNAYEGANSTILDLKGKTVLPGINDTHLHSVGFGSSRPPLSIDLTYPNIESIADMVEALGNKVDTLSPGDWVHGNGWDLGSLEECKNTPERIPGRWDLDAVSPENPVVFTDFSGHSRLVNSKVLELAGIDKNTPDPEGGEVVRDLKTGEPTGLFIEAMPIDLNQLIPFWSRDEKKQAIKSAIDLFHANGITSYTDAALGPGGDLVASGVMGSECIDIYREMVMSGELKARVTVLLLFGGYGALSFEDIQQGVSNYHVSQDMDRNWFQIPGIKIFADGIPPTKGAWMFEPYSDGSFGSLVISGETEEGQVQELTSMIDYAHRKGFQIGVHVTGDRAVDVTTDAFVKAIKKTPGRDLRHYLIHCDFISEDKMKLLVEYNCGISTQPAIKALTSDFMSQLIGKKKALLQNPLRSLIKSGVKVTGSSDAPVTYPNWLASVQAAVTRKSIQSGTVSGVEECITVEDAIRMFTINGAWQDHMEEVKGSIENGKLADFCVLDRDILTADPDSISDISVMMTIVGGEIVYDQM